MRKQIRVLCGVPKEHCVGGKFVTDQMFTTDKAHSSHEDVFKCMARYLVRVLGYKRMGSRDFAPPDGGPIRILTKKIRYGGLLVYGKEQARFMPEKRNAGNRGTIT